MDYKGKVIALLNSQELSNEQKEKLENIFPELKESGGEKIRKHLIDCVKKTTPEASAFKDIKKEEILAWLEKQGKQKPIKASYTAIAETGDGSINTLVTGELSTDSCDDEKKPADKVESKFHPGDWIVDNETLNDVFCVIEVLEEIYKVIDIDGDDYHIPHCKTDKQFHLWSTADAKDGDILCYKWPPTAFLKIAIFKRVAPKNELWGGTYRDHVQYGGYGSIENHILQVALGNDELTHCGSIACPATKEQRKLLFQKMKEAGYEWDNSKKELKRIEVKTLDADKVIGWLYENVANFWANPCNPQNVINEFKKDFGL